MAMVLQIQLVFWEKCQTLIPINPNHPKPFKLQHQGLLDFDGLNTVQP